MPTTNRSRLVAVLSAALLLSCAGSAFAQQSATVSAALESDEASIAPGSPFWVAVRFEIADTWHINWINPGDAGLAPSIAWRLPDGFKAGDIEWPYPRRYRVGPLAIFGYDREVLLLTRITPPADLRPGQTIELGADVDWLACQEGCVPGESSVSIRLPVAATARRDTASTAAFSSANSELPEPARQWNLGATYRADEITIEMLPVRPIPHEPLGVVFFPTEQGIIENAEEQRLVRSGSGFELRVPRSRAVGTIPARLTGVLVSSNGWSADGSPRALQVDVALEPR
jgi:DsbC/DsbD-like thiol-disulfide interchange protein